MEALLITLDSVELTAIGQAYINQSLHSIRPRKGVEEPRLSYATTNDETRIIATAKCAGREASILLIKGEHWKSR